MLNRFRDLVKRLELPEDERDIVYRIIDDDLIAVEVTAAQYGSWRMQNDVAQKAIVGQDTVENVWVRTTFSIMPENRNYKPFGTSAVDVTSLDPLLEYSRRYDTWREAERGHREALQRVRRNAATARAAEEKAEALAGTAGEVRLALSADLPHLFEIREQSENDVNIATPLLGADGASIELSVSAKGAGFTLTAAVEATPGDLPPLMGKPGAENVNRLCRSLGVSMGKSVLVCEVEDASQLGRAIVKLAQAAAYLSFLLSADSEN